MCGRYLLSASPEALERWFGQRFPGQRLFCQVGGPGRRVRHAVAFALHRYFQRRHPEKKPYRWGYYFSVQSFLVAIALGIVFDSSATAMMVFCAVYGALAWFFAQRKHWAWVTLTLFSFNPVVWIINFIYLRKRWTEDAVAGPA